MDLTLARAVLVLQLLLMVVVLAIQIVSIDEFTFFVALSYLVLVALILWNLRTGSAGRIGFGFFAEVLGGLFMTAAALDGVSITLGALMIGLSCFASVAVLAFAWQRRL